MTIIHRANEIELVFDCGTSVWWDALKLNRHNLVHNVLYIFFSSFNKFENSITDWFVQNVA